MEQPQSSAFSRKQVVAAVVAAAALGFVGGVQVGRRWEEPHAPELPCPSCRIERVPNTHLCQLVGQIDAAWPVAKSPVELPATLAGGDPVMFDPGECFRVDVDCEHATEPLKFKHHFSSLLFPNVWCSSGCVERMTCSP